MKVSKYTFLFGALALAAAGCDDYLDVLPDNRVEIKTPEQVRQLLIDAYSDANYASICEFSGDNIIDNNSPDDKGVRWNLTYYDLQDLECFSWEDIVSNIDTESPSHVWNGAYHAIAVCNQALKSIEEIEKSGNGAAVKAMKGEALVSRAYNHFVLANIFCMPWRGEALSADIMGLPYMTEVEDKVLVHYERLPLTEFYKKIEADLLEGLPLIDDSNYDVPKYHFNRKAAQAFAARFYLYTRQYDKVEQYATEALGGQGADPSTMMRTYWAQTFTTSDANTQYYISASEQCNFLLVSTYSTYNRRRGQRFSINRDAADATYQSAGPTWTNYNFHPCWSGKLYIRSSQEYGVFSLAAGGELFEYTDKIAGIGYCHIVRTEFTAEETLLARAEARLYLGRIDDAVADLAIWDAARAKNATNYSLPALTKELILKFYRDKDPGKGICKPLNIDYICPSDKYSLTDDILPYVQCALHYRRLETVENGLRWFDIRRYGIELEHKIGKDRVEFLGKDDERRAIQIPSDVLSAGFKPNRNKPWNESKGGEATVSTQQCKPIN